MTIRRPTRLRRALVALTALLAAIACTPAAAGETPLVVQDPHYGDALFHFYQGRHFSAITTLMASQQFRRLPHHEDDAEVLRGGLLLGYGLHDEAGAIFARLIERGTAAPVRDRAWFHLAKLRWQRGRLADADDALGRVGDQLPVDLDDERVLLQGQIALARNDPARAAELLEPLIARMQTQERIAHTRGAVAIARYNLGVALVRSGRSEQGRALLDTVGRAPAPDEETRALRDRANVALGFSALQDRKFEAARTALERVRLAGDQSNKALLGFGWAAQSLGRPGEALVPWLELAGRDASDAAALEARIAVPHAYAELGAHAKALAGFEEAIAAFDREGAAIDRSIAAIRAGRLEAALLERNPGEALAAYWNVAALPQMPHAGHLAPVLAQHAFQEAFRNYRDLRFLERNLADWRDRLGVYRDMLANRRQGYAERLPEVLRRSREVTLEPLAQRRDALAAELAQAGAAADGAAFADGRERALLERIARSREAIRGLGATDPDAAASRAKLRLASGALAWQLAREAPARLWEAKKALRALDAGLAEARERVAAIAAAQQQEPARHAQFDDRIGALARRVDALLPQVTALAGEQQHAVQAIAVAALEEQKLRLAQYLTQARYAVAQLYDHAQVTRSGGDDARQP